MGSDYAQRIKAQYEATRRGDSRELLKTVLAVGAEIGMDAALEILQACVVEKRLAWIEQAAPGLERSGDAVQDGYCAFYQRYLNLVTPRDGEIVDRSANRLVMRWWNPCSTLEACRELGLDTREICRKVYEAPVQAMLARIDPR